MADKAPERIWAWEPEGNAPREPWEASLDVVAYGAVYVREDIYNKAKMQSLADLGQAQDALDAQKRAEAENAKLREVLERIKSASEYYADPAAFWDDATTMVYAHESTVRLACEALGETENG